MSLLMKSITQELKDKAAKKRKPAKRKANTTPDGFPKSAPEGYGITIWANSGRQGWAVNAKFKSKKDANAAAKALKPGLDRGAFAEVKANIFVKRKK